MATYRLQKIFRQEASDAALEALRADKILRLQEARAEEKRRKEENRAKLLKGAAIGAATVSGLYAANKGWLGKGMRSLTRAGINLVTGKTDQAKMEWGRVGKGFQIDWRNTLGSKPAKTAVQQAQNQGQAPAANASQQNQGGQTPVVSAQGTGSQAPPAVDTSVVSTPPANGGITQNPAPPVTPTDTSVVSTQGNKGTSNRGGNRGRRNNSGQGNKGGSRGGKGNGSRGSSGATYHLNHSRVATADSNVPGGVSYSGKTKKQ